MKARSWESELSWSTLCDFRESSGFFFPSSPVSSSKLTELCSGLPVACGIILHTADVPQCLHFFHSAPPELPSTTTFLSVLCPLSAPCSQAFRVSQLCVCVCVYTCASHLCIVAGLPPGSPPSPFLLVTYCPHVCLSEEQWGSHKSLS